MLDDKVGELEERGVEMLEVFKELKEMVGLVNWSEILETLSFKLSMKTLPKFEAVSETVPKADCVTSLSIFKCLPLPVQKFELVT